MSMPPLTHSLTVSPHAEVPRGPPLLPHARRGVRGFGVVRGRRSRRLSAPWWAPRRIQMGRTLRKLEKCCIHCIVCADVGFSHFLRYLGPLLVLGANALIAFVTYMYLGVLVPTYVTPLVGTAPACLIVTFGLFLLFNILFNYWSCVLTSPGYPGNFLPAPDDLEAGTDFTDYGEGWRTCRKCHCGKPPRTHHCSVCRKCVMKMDHHCPWVNNCVGFYNYKFFCLFLLYLALGCAFVAATCLIPLSHPHGFGRNQLLMFTFVLTISILFALSLFIGWHVYLIATNQTTIEFYGNRMDAKEARIAGEVWANPYSVGLRENFEQVFGATRSWGAWLLPNRRKPPGDGMEFPVNPDAVPLHSV